MQQHVSHRRGETLIDGRNSKSSLSAAVSPQTAKLIDRIISKSEIFSDLTKLGYPTARANVLRAALITFLDNLDAVEKNPELLLRASTDYAMHQSLARIFKEEEKSR